GLQDGSGADLAGEEFVQQLEDGLFLGVNGDGCIGLQSREAPGSDDGLVEAAHLVDEAEFEGPPSRPHTAFGDFQDGLLGHAAAFGGLAGEGVIDFVAHGFEQGEVISAPTLGLVQDADVLADADGLLVDANLVVGLLQQDAAKDDADAAGHGGGIGKDAVCAHGDVVPAGGGDAAHADDDGDVILVADFVQAVPNAVAGDGAAASTVDADDQGAGRAVLDDLVQQVE